MEDQTSNQNLLQLHPPSSSSSTVFDSAAAPPEVPHLLGFFNNNIYQSSEPNEQLLPTSFFSMPHGPHNYPFLMTGAAYEESSGVSENSGGLGIGPRQVIDSGRVMGGKRRKMNNTKGEVMESPTEVIHVRAKRGQATDSHSLAERVRRERINEKMRVLQDLVPGCYKTMGTAVMFDVIIKYVQSLQNQIEFLSMKLSAASMFYDFSSPEAEAMEALQERGNPCEARNMETMIMRDEGFEGMNASPALADQSLHSTQPF